MLSEDVVALCFNACSILYTNALCYDDQFLYHTLCFHLSQGVTPEPQPQPLPHCPSLDVSLGNERGSKQPIKPHSPDSFRMKAIDPLTIYTPPSPHVASFHLRDLYCYYHPCIDCPKKHYGFKAGILGQSGSLGVDFSNLEMIKDDWELEFKEVSFLRRGLNLPVRPKEVEKTSPLKMPIRSSLDLYLLPGPKVFEPDVKGSTRSSSNAQNVAFVSSSTSSTNDVSTAYGISTSSGHNSQREGSSSYTDELIWFEMASGHDFHEIKEVLEEDWEKAACKSKGNQESRKGDARNTGYKAQDNERRPGKQEEPKALLTLDEDGSETEVTSCSKECEESYAKLKKLYDEQREQLGDASIEIQAYTQALKKKLLAEAVNEKEELKTKLENFQSSSKGLSKLLNSQMSAKDKSRLGYGDQIHEGVLSYENEVLESVFDNRSSDVKDSHVYDRFIKVEGMHAVPPSVTGIYMPPKSDFGIDESKFTYSPKQSKTSESDAKTSEFASCESNSSVETLESMPKPAVNEPKAFSKPKVWSDAPIIEEYESDSDDEYVIKPLKEQENPSFAFVNTVKHVKTPRKTVKVWEYVFTRKACFVCGSFGHLIRDCDFHEKRMVKHVELNKQKGKGTGQGENRPIQNLSSQEAATSAARKVNTARPIVNEIRPRTNFYKSHLSIRRPFNRTTTPKANFTNHKVNTAGDKTISAVGGNRETAVKASADDPQKTLKNKRIVDSRCSRHMTGNKAYLVEYQDYNVAKFALEEVKSITGNVK
ncbi:putative ribonuclease H-like domain-containing protein [Tanacetum coccineum]